MRSAQEEFLGALDQHSLEEISRPGRGPRRAETANSP
jgi:hypothetical protein